MDGNSRQAGASVPQWPHWRLAAGDRAISLAGTLCARLPDLLVASLHGADARAFLQAQCTADILALQPGSWQLAGLCSARGRLLAVFDVWREGDSLRLLLPADNAEATLAHLRRFVMRSKVRIDAEGDGWGVLGFLGEGATDALALAGWLPPAAPGTCVDLGEGARLARVPAGATSRNRFLLVAPRERIDSLRALVPGAREAGGPVWHWSGIEAAIPSIHEGTRELFVPQSVHLEVLGGVNFRKGCYPGQEVVARSQYLGRLRRRMALAHAIAEPAGADVFHDSAAREPVGRIVGSADAPSGGVDLLLECPSALMAAGALHAGARDAPALELRPLPYELFDPTA
jgi:folate-binding protein YgfZ